MTDPPDRSTRPAPAVTRLLDACDRATAQPLRRMRRSQHDPSSVELNRWITELAHRLADVLRTPSPPREKPRRRKRIADPR
jgi:hypothetical protein